MVRKAWILFIGLLLVAGLTTPALAQNAACDEAQARANIKRVIDEAFNQGNLAVIDEVFADNYQQHPDNLDREGFKTQVEGLQTAIPHGETQVDFVLVQGCDVFFTIHIHGLMEGPLAGSGGQSLPATDKELHLDNHIYLHLNDAGQVIEEWDYSDNLPLLMQTGIIPAPASTSPAAEPTEEAVMQPSVTMGGNEAKNTDAVRRAYEEGFNSGDEATLRKSYIPDYMGHNPDGTPQSLDEFVTAVASLRNAIPDGKITINGTVAEGDFVATRVTYSGTFQNALTLPGSQQSVPPSGKPISLEMSFLHQLSPEGLIVADWEIYDEVSFLSQLGVMGAPTSEATPEATP